MQTGSLHFCDRFVAINMRDKDSSSAQWIESVVSRLDGIAKRFAADDCKRIANASHPSRIHLNRHQFFYRFAKKKQCKAVRRHAALQCFHDEQIRLVGEIA